MERKPGTKHPSKGQPDIPAQVTLPVPVTQGPTREDNREIEASERLQEFFIPIHGFIYLRPEEVEVVNHPVFQRLGRVYQLGQAHLVFRGTTHRRFEHALGTLHVIQRMIDAVNRNARTAQPIAGNTWQPGRELSAAETAFIRLGALLHDVGHLPCGHTLEDELQLLDRHDSYPRLKGLLTHSGFVDRHGRTLEQLVDRLYAKFLDGERELTPSEVLILLVRKDPPKDADDPLGTKKSALAAKGLLRLEVCRDMIGNTICADLLDYLHRDWYHIGKPQYFDDRLLQYMEIRERAPETSTDRTSRGRPAAESAMVINLGKPEKPRSDAITAILALLEGRYELAETVLYHRTKLAASAMLERALMEIESPATSSRDQEEWREELLQLLLRVSDDELPSRLYERSTKLKDGKDSLAARLLLQLNRRELFVPLNTRFYGEIPTYAITPLLNLYGGSTAAPRNRLQAMRQLERDFGLQAGALAMYCPPDTSMNVKIAQVRIFLSDQVFAFNEYEQKFNHVLSGGHLDAQQRRFQRLWRIHVFIDRKEKERMRDLWSHLVRAVDQLVLQRIAPETTLEDASRDIAHAVVAIPSSHVYGWQFNANAGALIGARGDENAAMTDYPTGAFSILRFIEKRRGDGPP